MADLADWLEEFTREGTLWCLKRLAANDTLATKANQAGPYIPKDFLFEVFPGLNDRTRRNPDIRFDASIDSHGDRRPVRAVWYNNRFFGVKDGRNEARVTNWGGRASAILNPENTGALAAFIFQMRKDGTVDSLHVWVCEEVIEEELMEDRFGPVEPGTQFIWRPSGAAATHVPVRVARRPLPCTLSPSDMPPSWLAAFPPGAEIVRKAVERRPLRGATPDVRLSTRRECEYEIFRSVENAIEGPRIARGFGSVNEFVSHANSVLQRRKSRSGRSLELQAREIFIEEGLVEGITFSHQPESDPGKKPDFLFPSEAAYKDPAFDPTHLRLLAAKTTCKDRWRQVTHEGGRIAIKHLLTLQEGVSEAQFAEMKAAGVHLVVPTPLIKKFPKAIQADLITLSDFINSVRLLGTGSI